MEENDLAWTDSLVGRDDLELASVLDGLEQVELDGGLVLASDVFLDEDEAIARIPRLRLPATLEVAEPARHVPPSLSAFDHGLELGKALEGHRDGEGDAEGVQSLDDPLVEERAVDAHLDLCPRQALAHRAYTALDARFTAASDMLHELAAQDSDASLARRLRRFTGPQLLAIDEVGYGRALFVAFRDEVVEVLVLRRT